MLLLSTASYHGDNKIVGGTLTEILSLQNIHLLLYFYFWSIENLLKLAYVWCKYNQFLESYLSLGLVIKNELASQSKILLAMNWTWVLLFKEITLKTLKW